MTMLNEKGCFILVNIDFKHTDLNKAYEQSKAIVYILTHSSFTYKGKRTNWAFIKKQFGIDGISVSGGDLWEVKP